MRYNTSSRFLNTDCVHYRGNMPCAPHKLDGRLCADCSEYRPLRDRILIVKLGAMGDVLRTTALLPDIVANHEAPHVTWLTRPDSAELLLDNPLIDCVITTANAALLAVSAPFSVCYALDNDIEGLAFARIAKSKSYKGFIAGPFDTCVGVAAGGDSKIFDIGVWDDLKRANGESYLKMLAAAVGISYSGGRPIVPIDAAEETYARACLADLPRPLIGVNIDAGGRWERKRWNPEHIEMMVEQAVSDGFGVVAFGGAEVEMQKQSLSVGRGGAVIAFQSTGNARRLCAGISLCDVVVTGDTLGMHVAWGCGVPVVALFGPTSSAEIDLASDDVKLSATDLACLGCYLPTCTVSPHCMDRLGAESVYAAVRERLRA